MDLDTELSALRRLAGALASSADADDLVQDTMLAALRRAPEEDRPVRPWLQTVLRNRRASRLLARAREQARLAAMPPASPEPSPEHLQLMRELIAEIQALPEDDRRLLTLRFWEGATTPECAATLDRPPSTVRTQLGRILERLRVRLDRTRGGRAAWMPLALPLGHSPVAPTASATSTLFGGKTIAVGGVVAATVMWLGVAMPYGCGAHAEQVGDVAPDGERRAGEDAGTAQASGAAPTRRTRASRAARRARRGDDGPPATAEPSPSDADDDVPPYQTPQVGASGGVHPLLALSMGLRQWWNAAIPCRVGAGDGSVRLALTARFDPDGSTTFERVDASRVRGLNDREVDCVRQTLFARQTAIERVDNTLLGFDADTTLQRRIAFVVHLDGETADITGTQPVLGLYLDKQRTPQLTDAIAACGEGPIEVELEFAPTTGALVRTQVRGDHARTDRGRCTAEAIEARVTPTVPFDPEVPGDASMVCRFGAGDEGGYLCRSLGVSTAPRAVE